MSTGKNDWVYLVLTSSLCLEWGRLNADNRDEASYKG
jgi:hypothetical protein